MNKRLLTILLLFILLVPIQTFAGCEGPITPPCAPNCGFCDLFDLVENVLAFVLTCLVPIVGAIMLVWGGFTLLSAGTSPAKVEQAKGIISAVVIGIVIIFVAWVFLNTFLTSIGVAEWTGLESGWWDISCQ